MAHVPYWKKDPGGKASVARSRQGDNKPSAKKVGVSRLAKELGMGTSNLSKELKSGRTVEEIRERRRQEQLKAGEPVRNARGHAVAPLKRQAGMKAHRASKAQVLVKDKLDEIEEEDEVIEERNTSWLEARRKKEWELVAKERALALQRRIELATQVSELVPSYLVRAWVTEIAIGQKDILVKLVEIVDHLGVADPAKARKMIQEEVNRVLEKMRGLVEKLGGSLKEQADQEAAS